MNKLDINKKTLAITNLDLEKEWDYEENLKCGLQIENLYANSSKKAHWICPKGHKYPAFIYHRATQNSGCPYCSNQKVLIGYNDLATTRPDILKNWDYEENNKIGLTPQNVMAGTNKKAHWICEKNHPYEAYINNRTKLGTGCPYCASQKILVGYNDLATTRPDLLNEWNYSLNEKIGLTPESVMAGTRKSAHWICPVGHNYSKDIYLRALGQGCTVCAKGSQTSFPEQAILFYLRKIFKNVENRYGKPELDIYIHDINFGIEYDGYYAHKNKVNKEKEKDKIIESRGIRLLRIKEINNLIPDTDKIIYCKPNTNNTYLNDIIRKIINRIDSKLNNLVDVNIQKDRLKIEEQYLVGLNEKSIAKLYPDIAKDWDYENNGGIKPEFVSWGSRNKYYWICEKKHSYLCSPYDRTKGRNCNICCGYDFIKGINDLETKVPEIIKYWDYNKNEVLPNEIKYTKTGKFFWKCDNGHSYRATIKDMRKYNSCLLCHIGEKDNNDPSFYALKYGLIKGKNDFKTLNPELASEWDFEKNELLPEDYLYSSNKEVWWKCKNCGHSWLSNMNQRKSCPECKRKKITYNIYSVETGELLGTFIGLRDVCKFLNVEYSKQRGNICSVTNRNQKTIENKYIVRKDIDDEFKSYDIKKVKELISNFLAN